MAKRESRQSVLSEGARIERKAILRWLRARRDRFPYRSDEWWQLDKAIEWILTRDVRTGKAKGGVGRR